MTSAPRDISVYLEDIVQAVARIDTYVTGMTFDAFALDTKTQDAVVRNLEIIGRGGKALAGRLPHRASGRRLAPSGGHA